MKKLFFILSLALAATATLDAKTAQAGDCNAYTYCPNLGVTIACETWGAGCTWYVAPYQAVQCTGFDFYGFWRNYVVRCY